MDTMTPDRIEMKTTQLSGKALDWAVAKAIGAHHGKYTFPGDAHAKAAWIFKDGVPCTASTSFQPTTNWSHTGPLIDRMSIEFEYVTDATIRAFALIDSGVGFGGTHLVAACRAIVDAKFGDTVQVPAALLGVE